MLNKSEYTNQILCGHALEILHQLPPKIAQCCITSPPYWGLRLYQGEQEQFWGGKKDCEHKLKENFCLKCDAYLGALGLESLHDCLAWAKGKQPCVVCYVCHLRTILVEVKRVLRDDGTLWLNLGDCYATSANGRSAAGSKARCTDDRTFRDKPFSTVSASLKAKNLAMMPARVALALQASGYTLRSVIPWLKRNTTPESIRDRPTIANEWIFMLAKSEKEQYWTHPQKRGTRQKPKPDKVYIHRRTREQVKYQPVSDQILKQYWIPKNLWRSHHYYYNIDAIRLPHKTATNRNITGRSQKYSGKFDKSICETVSSPRARQNRNGYTPSYYHPTGRNRRTTDWWYESLQLIIKQQHTYLNLMAHIQNNQGLLIDETGMPLGFNINTRPFKQPHFAVFPPTLIEPCLLAGTAPSACANCSAPYTRQPTCDCKPACNRGKCIVLDPFVGSGTVALTAIKHDRDYIGIDISQEYCDMARQRITQETKQFKFSFSNPSAFHQRQ